MKAPLPRSGLGIRDLMTEIAAGLAQRPARSLLTMLGAVLGISAFVAVLGLTGTASSQIDSRFTALRDTEVVVEDVAKERDEFAGPAFPADSGERVEALNGVRHAGVLWTVRPRRSADELAVRGALMAGAGEQRLNVVAAAPGALLAAEPALREGRLFDEYHTRARQQVAVISAGVAARLGITTVETRPAVFIGDQPFTVIGIVDDVRRQSDMLLSLIVPHTTAEEIWGAPQQGARLLVSTDLGAARQVAGEVAPALRPDRPEYLKVIAPPDPKRLRASVTSDLEGLFLILAGVCLLIGAVGIANTTLVSVLERTGEIGVRRALGAWRRHVLLQFLAESGSLGLLGGLMGMAVGTAAVLLVSVVRGWTPVIDTWILAAAPLVGALTGVLAGAYPAWRAARIAPVEALRR